MSFCADYQNSSNAFGRAVQVPRKDPWAHAGIEPTIAELLSDPIADALMRVDGVKAVDVLTLVQRISIYLNDANLAPGSSTSFTELPWSQRSSRDVAGVLVPLKRVLGGDD